MLFDSDVVIWALRGRPSAQSLFLSIDESIISAVSYMEIVRGLRSKQESLHWKSFIAAMHIKILPINEIISNKAMYWVEEFGLSHGLDIPDALIAATADTNGVLLLTCNFKDYKFIPGLAVKHFKEE